MSTPTVHEKFRINVKSIQSAKFWLTYYDNPMVAADSCLISAMTCKQSATEKDVIEWLVIRAAILEAVGLIERAIPASVPSVDAVIGALNRRAAEIADAELRRGDF